jgi:hypothetical protein
MTTTLVKQLAVLAKAPNSSGLFSGRIESNPPKGDSDGERINDWTNLPGTFPLIYSHTYNDPGSEIGTIRVMPDPDGRHLNVEGRLDIKGPNPMATAVHERMLLPSSDPLALKELSVGFAFAPDKTTTDDGVKVIHGAELLEVSLVARGAQRTEILEVKARKLGWDKQHKRDVWDLKHRIELLDPLSLLNVAKALEAIEGATNKRDRALRREIDTVDAVVSSDDHELHPDNTIRALTKQLDELAGQTTTNPEKRAAAARQAAREYAAEEDARIREMIDSHQLDVTR